VLDMLSMISGKFSRMLRLNPAAAGPVRLSAGLFV